MNTETNEIISETFIIKYDYCSTDKEEQVTVKLSKITENLYTDGQKYFEFSENFVYVIEDKKKKKVAKRKGKNLVLSTKHDEIIFSPTITSINSNRSF